MEVIIKGESYSKRIKTNERQLHDLLMNEENTISVEKALEKEKKKYHNY